MAVLGRAGGSSAPLGAIETSHSNRTVIREYAGPRVPRDK
jgi:hypothetical protein